MKIILFLIYPLVSFSQDFLPIKYLSNTFNIQYNGESGTSFLAKYQENTYLITAKHLFNTKDTLVSFSLAKDSISYSLEGQIFFHKNPFVDIAVILPKNPIETSIAYKLAGNGTTLGDSGFFLGFPYGLKSIDKENVNQSFPIPLIKKAVLSGVLEENKALNIILDGHNNPGFSGGPVLFRNRRNSKDLDWYLIGVISGYIKQNNSLVTPVGNFNYSENSGIIVATGSKHIKEIIDEIK